jgi:orotate phosphoribosyltransferase
VRESIAMITAAGGRPCGVAIALDRQERATVGGQDAPWSAVQYVTRQLQLDVASIATLEDLLQYLRAASDPALSTFAGPVQAYRERYGV